VRECIFYETRPEYEQVIGCREKRTECKAKNTLNG